MLQNSFRQRQKIAEIPRYRCSIFLQGGYTITQFTGKFIGSGVVSLATSNHLRQVSSWHPPGTSIEGVD